MAALAWSAGSLACLDPTPILVAAADGSSLVLLDEYGLADVETTPGVEQPAEAELVLAEGVVDVRHGAALLKVTKVSGWHPGVIPLPAKAGAA